MSMLRRAALLNAAANTPGHQSIPRLEERPPPLRPEHAGHPQFYGFAVDEEWVMTEGCKLIPGYNELQHKPNVQHTIYLLLNALCVKAGIRGRQLQLVSCEAVHVNPNVRVKATTELMDDGTPFISIFSLCTSSRSSWNERPTLEQIRILTETIGCRPAWYVGI
ncbi:hypothetical protein CPC08DRAFT_760135 [Agrocybe pediades]|nr:hypothetical protein CPC08DRAFT_760135 [Agrocybe pediades]